MLVDPSMTGSDAFAVLARPFLFQAAPSGMTSETTLGMLLPPPSGALPASNRRRPRFAADPGAMGPPLHQFRGSRTGWGNRDLGKRRALGAYGSETGAMAALTRHDCRDPRRDCGGEGCRRDRAPGLRGRRPAPRCPTRARLGHDRGRFICHACEVFPPAGGSPGMTNEATSVMRGRAEGAILRSSGAECTAHRVSPSAVPAAAQGNLRWESHAPSPPLRAGRKMRQVCAANRTLGARTL